MTNISIYRNQNKDIIKYILDGHTEFSEEGTDIVCSAITSLAMNTLNGLTEIVQISVGYEVKDGYLECILPLDLDKKAKYGAKVLTESMLLSLKSIEKQYPSHITITELEV